MSSLNKIFEMCEAQEEVQFSPYLSQVNTTKIKISIQYSEKLAHNFSEKKNGTVYSASENDFISYVNRALLWISTQFR